MATRGVGASLGSAFQRDLARTIVSQAQRGVAKGMNDYFRRFGKAYAGAAGTGLSDMYQRLGEVGQRASVDRYLAARSDRPEYRVGQGRISGGALRRAIESPDYFRASSEGLAFARTDVLNREAKHWARINYSANKAHHSPIQFRFDGVNIGTYQTRRAIRPLWEIPVPFTLKGSEFHVGKKWRGKFRKIQDSHEPFHFIEAGIEAISKEFERELLGVMDVWENRAKSRAGNKA